MRKLSFLRTKVLRMSTFLLVVLILAPMVFLGQFTAATRTVEKQNLVPLFLAEGGEVP
jgi:hypothetical protein